MLLATKIAPPIGRHCRDAIPIDDERPTQPRRGHSMLLTEPPLPGRPRKCLSFHSLGMWSGGRCDLWFRDPGGHMISNALLALLCQIRDITSDRTSNVRLQSIIGWGQNSGFSSTAARTTHPPVSKALLALTSHTSSVWTSRVLCNKCRPIQPRALERLLPAPGIGFAALNHLRPI
jgi:hypothetical protein